MRARTSRITYFAGSLILLTSFVSGVILNFVALGESGKSFFEIITLNKLGSALVVWSYNPMLCGILLAGCITGGIIMKAAGNK